MARCHRLSGAVDHATSCGALLGQVADEQICQLHRLRLGMFGIIIAFEFCFISLIPDRELPYAA